MANESTQFSSENQPKERKKRGKAQRTLVLEALKAEGKDEAQFYQLMVERSLNAEDPSSAMLMKELFSRLYPNAKPTMPMVNFDFPYNASSKAKVDALEKAVSECEIPVDVAKMMVDIIKSSMEIEKVTELMDRIESIEKALNASKSS